MNKKDIIRMAREAGFVSAEFWPEHFQGLFGCAERFAALVAAAERAKCVAKAELVTLDYKSNDYYNGWLDMRDAIVDKLKAME